MKTVLVETTVKLAKDLCVGDWFKTQKQRNWREVGAIRQLPNSDKIPIEDRGKLLIITTTCRQWVVSPDLELVSIKNKEQLKNLL